MKKILKKILFTPKIAKFVIRLLLKIHSLSYIYVSSFASGLEDGIHPKHRLTNYHQFFIDNISAGDTILDIGCGKGILSYELAKKAKLVYGIDINAENIEYAKKNFNAKNIIYIIGDATNYEFNQYFDVGILSNVLEHIENRIEFLKKVSSLTKYLLIRVPMSNREWIVLYKKELGLEWKSDPTHFIEYTFDSFAKEVVDANLKIEKSSIQFGEIWAKVIKNERN